MDGIDDIAFLAGSEYRARIVELLQEHGSLSKTELRDACSASSVTLSRNLDQLEEHGCIVETGDGFRLTAAGQLLAEDFFELLDSAALVSTLRPFLRWVPESEFGLDIQELADAEVVIGEATDPYAPMDRHLELLEAGCHVKELAPAVALDSVQTARDAVLENDARHKIVITEDVYEKIKSNQRFTGLFEEILASDSVRFFVYDGQIPFFLSIVDNVVQIAGQDEEGLPRALVESDAKSVRTWADDVYMDYQADAVPLSSLA